MIQRAHGWNNTQMAEWLGISRPLWIAAVKGSTRFGAQSLRKIRRNRPEFAPAIDAYLAGVGDAADEPMDEAVA
jgi:hypothetical protein